MNQIHDSLTRVLSLHRLVFWYDATEEWSETFDAFAPQSAIKLRVDGNDFGAKVQIAQHSTQRFLVYVPAARPADRDNWLLDLLLQGYEYRADRASLLLLDLGLSHDFRDLVEAHLPFFGSAKRTEALRGMLTPVDQVRDVRLKMMAVLAGTTPDVDEMLLNFLRRSVDAESGDPVTTAFSAAKLAAPFWVDVERLFGYANAEPSVRDFAVRLFRGANPLDGGVPLHAHGKVFLQRWKDSQQYCESYRTLANALERDLQVREALGSAPDVNLIGANDTFELFERAALHHLATSFSAGAPAEDLRTTLTQRRTSFWRESHAHGYDALDHAISLRELLAKADLTVESIDDGLRRYTQSWWRIDTAYRRCMYHLRQYQQVTLMEPIKEWVESHYINDFLLPLADRWSDQVKSLSAWAANELPPQRRFFDTWVEPFRSRGQKVFVIISDALRYEAAADFAERLTSANRWSAEVEAAFGSLPSFTQLGMASLLPGQTMTLDAGGTVSVDGQSASGVDNRGDILAKACAGRATAIKSDEFLNLNSKAEGRELMHANDVIFIYHNTIDHIGDKRDTEVRTTDAVAQAFKELDEIIRKVANINGTNMLLTADHGFLFQQNRLDDGDMTALPSASEWPTRNRRFSLGRDVSPASGVKLFAPDALGVKGDWTAAFPLGLGRFPLQGSGKLYVHGGLSLQEIVIPVVKIHKKRSDDTGTVDIDLLGVPTKITTGRLSVTLFQRQVVAGKMLPRTLRIGVFGKDGTSISEQRTLTFDSAVEEARLREQSVMLVLSAAADKMNNQDVQVRLEELVQGTTNQWVTYRSHILRLQKPFTSDFDDL